MKSGDSKIPLTHRVENRRSGRAVEALILHAGRDLLVRITGGTHPHIGTVVLARSDEGGLLSVEALTIPPHKEEAPARAIAGALARASGRTVVVTAGIHEDELDAGGIQEYLELADRMAEELARIYAL